VKQAQGMFMIGDIWSAGAGWCSKNLSN